MPARMQESLRKGIDWRNDLKRFLTDYAATNLPDLQLTIRFAAEGAEEFYVKNRAEYKRMRPQDRMGDKFGLTLLFSGKREGKEITTTVEARRLKSLKVNGTYLKSKGNIASVEDVRRFQNDSILLLVVMKKGEVSWMRSVPLRDLPDRCFLPQTSKGAKTALYVNLEGYGKWLSPRIKKLFSESFEEHLRRIFG